jgi:alpha-1,3-rhamnosyl/mannosyltransferase
LNLARALEQTMEPDERLHILLDPSRPALFSPHRPESDQVRFHELAGGPFTLSQQWRLPALLRRIGAGIYHSPYLLMPLRPGVPTVLTVHDLIPLKLPDQSTAKARLFFSLALRLALATADRVIAVSRATRDDLLAWRPLDPTAVDVIMEGVDEEFRPCPEQETAALRERLGLAGQYALYVGADKPHKNLDRLLQAWARTGPHGWALVVAGAAQQERPAQAGVRFVGRVDQADLPALYSGAGLFVFPSLYEGFGLPVLEAMACGAPVACSDRASLPEVAGEAAVYFDPEDVQALARVLEDIMTDPPRREALRNSSLSQARRFTWRRAALSTLAVYRGLAGRT